MRNRRRAFSSSSSSCSSSSSVPSSSTKACARALGFMRSSLASRGSQAATSIVTMVAIPNAIAAIAAEKPFSVPPAMMAGTRSSASPNTPPIPVGSGHEPIAGSVETNPAASSVTSLGAGIPAFMKGVQLVGHGGIEKLVYREDIPTPVPGPGEVLIRVAAAAVNNTDINTRIGSYSKSITPAVCTTTFGLRLAES